MQKTFRKIIKKNKMAETESSHLSHQELDDLVHRTIHVGENKPAVAVCGKNYLVNFYIESEGKKGQVFAFKLLGENIYKFKPNHGLLKAGDQKLITMSVSKKHILEKSSDTFLVIFYLVEKKGNTTTFYKDHESMNPDNITTLRMEVKFDHKLVETNKNGRRRSFVQEKCFFRNSISENSEEISETPTSSKIEELKSGTEEQTALETPTKTVSKQSNAQEAVVQTVSKECNTTKSLIKTVSVECNDQGCVLVSKESTVQTSLIKTVSIESNTQETTTNGVSKERSDQESVRKILSNELKPKETPTQAVSRESKTEDLSTVIEEGNAVELKPAASKQSNQVVQIRSQDLNGSNVSVVKLRASATNQAIENAPTNAASSTSSFAKNASSMRLIVKASSEKMSLSQKPSINIVMPDSNPSLRHTSSGVPCTSNTTLQLELDTTLNEQGILDEQAISEEQAIFDEAAIILDDPSLTATEGSTTTTNNEQET